VREVAAKVARRFSVSQDRACAPIDGVRIFEVSDREIAREGVIAVLRRGEIARALPRDRLARENLSRAFSARSGHAPIPTRQTATHLSYLPRSKSK
jgi:hypothetical protein